MAIALHIDRLPREMRPMNMQSDFTQNQVNSGDASRYRDLVVELGQVLLERAREVGHQIEDRVERALTQGGTTEGGCQGCPDLFGK